MLLQSRKTSYKIFCSNCDTFTFHHLGKISKWLRSKLELSSVSDKEFSLLSSLRKHQKYRAMFPGYPRQNVSIRVGFLSYAFQKTIWNILFIYCWKQPALFLIFVLFYIFLCCSMYFCAVLCIFVLFYVLFVLFYVFFVLFFVFLCCSMYFCAVLCIFVLFLFVLFCVFLCCSVYFCVVLCIFVLFCVFLCCSVYCLCCSMYCLCCSMYFCVILCIF